MVGSGEAGKALGVSAKAVRRYINGQSNRKIESYISTRVGDDPDALLKAAMELESPRFAHRDEEAQVSRQPRPEYMPLSIPPLDSSNGSDSSQGLSRTLTVEPHPLDRLLPPPIPALVTEWRHIVSQDTGVDSESGNKKQRIAALKIRERRLDAEIKLIEEHKISLAGSPDVHWDELRRREEYGWRRRELSDIRERLRKLERFSEVFSWLRSPFSAR